MLAVIIPLRALELGAPPAIIGLIAGAAGIVPALLSIPSGGVADRFGSRSVYLWSGLGCAVVSVGFALTDSYWAMFGLQLAVGLTRNTAWVAAQTYASHVAAGGSRARIMSTFAFAGNAGLLLAPLAAGLIAQVAGFQVAFLAAAAVALVFTGLGALLEADAVSGRGSWRDVARPADYRDASRLLRNTGVLIVVLLTFVRLFTSQGWLTFFPVLLASTGVGAARIGALVGSQSLVAAVCGLSVPFLVRRWSGEVILFAAMGGCALAVALTPYTLAGPLVILSPILIGLGSGLSLPLLLGILADDTPRGQRGIAMGLRSCSNSVAATLAPISLGLVAAAGPEVAFWTNGLLSAAVVVAAVFLHVTARRSAPATTQPHSQRLS